MDLVLDELLLLPLHHPLKMVQLLLVVNQHLVALQKEQVLHQHHPLNHLEQDIKFSPHSEVPPV